jgi:hypothetical protein
MAVILLVAALVAIPGRAQFEQTPGHSMGAVATHGKLIVLTLKAGALGKVNLFDLEHHTLRFTPARTGYRVESVPSTWDADYGAALKTPEVTLEKFVFPFSGKAWKTLSIGETGTIVPGPPEEKRESGRRGAWVGREGGLAMERYVELAEAGSEVINTVPALSVFFKPRMTGTRYWKELDERAVVTWSLSEPVGGIQDWTWTPTVNRFQAILHRDGVIEFSWDKVAARDALVGVFPLVKKGEETTIGTLDVQAHEGLPANLDVRQIALSAVDGLFLKVRLEARGVMLPRNDLGIAGIGYTVCLDKIAPAGGCRRGGSDDAVWTVSGTGAWKHESYSGGPQYRTWGSGLRPEVNVEGNSLWVEGTLPEGYQAGDRVFVSAAVELPGTKEPVQIPAHAVKLEGVSSPAVHFATMRGEAGPFPAVYEGFHYGKAPRPEDLTCSVIQALGDRFDLLAYYSDFRVDNPEAGTSSDGPRGGGPGGGEVTGIGAEQAGLADYCTKGRFQWQFVQPVYAGANQMQEYPPADLKNPDRHDIMAYSHPLEERTSNGKIPPYNYAMSQIGHEMGHRWSAFVSAKVNGETVDLGPVHWAMGLQAPAPFPYQRPTEASAMGGGVWQDNYDGTYTQLDDNYYVPATGYSYLDLYLMGLISANEVPDFFILRNLVPAGRDAQGRPIYKANRTKVTIQDVIAAEGPRQPDVDQAQKDFNTGMVVAVEHGKTPSAELIERTNGIRERWIDYWATVTGHRSTMTAEP